MATKDKGRWRIRWTVGGEEFSKTLPAGVMKREAEEIELKIRLGLIDPRLATTSPKLEDYAERFLTVYPTIKKRSAATLVKDRFALDCHILPAFGKRRLREVTAPDVLDWQARLHQVPLKPQSVNNTVSCLSSIFRLAVLERQVDFNPCASIPRLARPKPKPVFWTPEEARRFLGHVREVDWEVYQICMLAICSGMRPGELMGLKRDCLDFELGYVDVRRNWDTKTRELNEHTKGHTEGKVPLPRPLLEALADKRDLVLDQFVFPHLKHERAFSWLRLKPLAEEAGVKYISLHKLRHTFATHLRLNRVPAVEIRDLLRHKSLKSSEIYMHAVDDFVHGATDCIAAGLGDGAFKRGRVVNLRRL